MTGGDDPWALLGIEPTGDVREIRRAYAARLRVTRPDDDPRGFQKLLEARDRALVMGRRAVVTEDDPNTLSVSAAECATRDQVDLPERALPGLAEPGTVEMELPTGGNILEGGAASSGVDVEELLEEIEAPLPGRAISSKWTNVFDALEQSSLQDNEYLTWCVLARLVADLRRDVPDIPDLIGWGMEPTENDKVRLGGYADVLRDLENRFRFLSQDRVLLDYLDEEDARDLVNALTIAAGRFDPAEIGRSPPTNVVPIGRAFIDAAFGGDIQMRAYYERARKADRYPWSFSIFALLFPTLFAINYRLYGPALVSAAALAALITVLELKLPFVPLALGFYIIVAVSLALRSRRMRLDALTRKVRYLVGKGYDGLTVQRRLTAWGQQNHLWRVAFLIFILFSKMGAIGEISRFFSEIK